MARLLLLPMERCVMVHPNAGPIVVKERSRESRVLARYPDIRHEVLSSPGFQSWRRSLPVIEIDGERLYVRGGDMLRDEDQVIFEWARKAGLLTDAAITAALADRDA